MRMTEVYIGPDFAALEYQANIREPRPSRPFPMDANTLEEVDLYFRSFKFVHSRLEFTVTGF